MKIKCQCDEFIASETVGLCACGHDRISHPYDGPCFEKWEKT